MDLTPQKTPQSSPEAPAVTPDAQRFVTPGQTIHKWSTYISIDWVLNYITGVAFAMWSQYNPIGQKYWSQPMKKGATVISEKLFRFKPGAGLEKSVDNVLMVLSVIVGGMFTIPPLMVAESKPFRKWFSKGCDEMIYGKEAVENDPKFAEAYEAIDHAPKQGFWTGLTSRIAALTPCIATVYFKTPQKLSAGYFDFIERNSARAYNAIGLTEDRLFKGKTAAEKAERWQFLHRNSAIDFGLEPAYAFLHMLAYRGFAQKLDTYQHHRAEVHTIKQQNERDEIAIEQADDKQKPSNQVGQVAYHAQLKNAPEQSLAT